MRDWVLACLAFGFAAGGLAGYRVGQWRAFRTLGQAELRNRLNTVRNFRERG